MAINFLNTVAVDENVLFVDTVNDRVGIGTASPDAKLDVRSTSRTAPVVLKLGNGIISGDNGIIVSQIRSYINNSNNTADELARIQVENSSASHDDGNLSFWTRDGFNNVDAAKQLQINGKGVVELKKSGTAALPVLVLGEDVDTGFFRPSSNNIALSTAGSERVRVTSGGNVGIGVTAPQKKLSVYGDTLIESSGLTASLWFRPSATYNAGGIQTMKVTGSGNPYHTTISFSNYNAANVLNIVNDKVGIGTTAPSAKLDVNGTGTFRGNLDIYKSNAKLTVTSTGASEQAGIDVQNGTLHARWILDSDDLLRVYNQTSSFDAFAIKSSGKVGIGTASPSEKLEVDGNIKIQSALLSNQEELDASIGVNVIANVAIATYTAAFFDFVIKKVGNIRSGTVYACHDGTNVEFTETSTNDLGNTSDVTLSVDISGANMRLIATTISDEWEIKSLIRAI